jgi:hypothetical protein
MSFTAGDCVAGVTRLLMNRTVAPITMMEAIRKSVLELTEDYKHPLLEDTGPIMSLIAYQNNYAPSFFLQIADASLDVSKVNSFYIFNNPYAAPSLSNLATNSGYDLKFRSVDAIEVLLNIPGIPMYWTRNNNQIYLASMPDNTYNLYMRYQTQHPLSQTVINTTGLATAFQAQQIMMADEWMEILERASAMRAADEVNLANKRVELYTSLYGDAKFQTSSGIEGAPGLIFQRTSQRNRDQGTTTRRMRLRMGSV